MQPPMRALLNQIVDYAGLFPPAKLDLNVAVCSYLRDRKASPHRWMLGRFVCPTTRLKELASLAKPDPNASLLQVAALGQPSARPGDFIEQLRADIEIIKDFCAGWESAAVLDTVELALPKGATIALLRSQLAFVPEELGEMGMTGFMEVPMSASWSNDVAELCNVLHDMQHTQPGGVLGMKLRCGGLTAEAFPSDAQVAQFIACCSAAHLPWKATAGLHHPRRHWDESLQVWHHGFLNVAAAGVLGRLHALTEIDLASILADRHAEFLRCDDERLSWMTWSATAAQIADARPHSFTAFGSCSFDEPCMDLTGLGLLDASA
jgi:hypothetical protein